VWAVVKAVHAQDALTYSNFFGRLTGSLTIRVTEMTMTAFAARFSYTYSPEGECRQHAKKGPEGADEPAVEAGNLEVQ